jgi:hypothetical protein
MFYVRMCENILCVYMNVFYVVIAPYYFVNSLACLHLCINSFKRLIIMSCIVNLVLVQVYIEVLCYR